MKKYLLVIFVFVLPFASFTYYVSYVEEKAEVEELVLVSYVNGAFNDLNPDAMAAGFDPNFAIFSAKGNELSKYPIADWVSSVRKKKNDPAFNPAENVWKHKFSNVHISGNVATIQVDLSKDGKHIYTDYLSLIKFENNWRIVAKVYYKHP
jgi:hypothetical protein